MRNVHKILGGKTKREKAWGLKMGLTKLGFGGGDCVHVAQDFRGYANEPLGFMKGREFFG
jgi:hypothetical protein